MGTDNAAAAGPGTLFIVSTPIGNLSDISLRALETLKNADLIAAEDTRNSRKLLSHFDIHTPLTSYHEHNRFEKARELIQKLEEGLSVALITDAGTPAISDPGEVLVAACIDRSIPITAVPGPSALINALVLSGMSTDRVVFEGFLPRGKKRERDLTLSRLRDETGTIVLYESPHHLSDTLRELAGVLGADRPIALCREMTKLHEEVLRGPIGELTDIEPRGEYVLVIEGARAPEPGEPEREEIARQVEAHIASGLDEKEAMRRVARDLGVSRREIYSILKYKGGEEWTTLP